MDNAETFDTTSVELAYGKTKIQACSATKTWQSLHLRTTASLRERN